MSNIQSWRILKNVDLKVNLYPDKYYTTVIDIKVLKGVKDLQLLQYFLSQYYV